MSTTKSTSQTDDKEPTERIDYNTKRRLVEDMERNGGIQAFTGDDAARSQKICKMLDSDTATYGQRGDKQREQLSRCIRCWRRIHRKGLHTEKVLDRHKVKAWAHRTNVERQQRARLPVGRSPKQREQQVTAAASDSSDASTGASIADPKPAGTTEDLAAAAGSNTGTSNNTALAEKSSIVQASLVGLLNVDTIKRSLEGERNYRTSARKRRKMKALK